MKKNEIQILSESELSSLDEAQFKETMASATVFLKPLLKKPECFKKYKNMRELLIKHTYPADYAKFFRVLFEEQIKRDINKMAVLQYLHMQTIDEWGDLGEQRILISYCRHLLKISNYSEVTQADADNFSAEIKLLTKDYRNLKPEKLRRLDEQIKCNVFYRQVDYSKEEDINFMLEFLNSTRGLIAGQLAIYRSVIYGKVEIKKIAGYRVTTFLEELARTPSCVLSIAAVVGGQHIAMRHDSCETIFANKWQGFFKQPSFELYFNLLNELENISLAFKARALAAYKIKKTVDVEKKKRLFIDEILEGLIWHELGHGIVINSLLSVEDSAFGEALGVLGANVISVMKEILADWAPVYKEIKGPLNHFCDIAKEDEIKATRLLYVYFSDNWFLGEELDQFANHSDIMISLIIKHIKKDASINFNALRRELRGKKDNLFEQVLKDYNRITKYLEKLIKKENFKRRGQKINFLALKEIYVRKVKKVEPTVPEGSLEFLVSMWAKILEDMPTLNKEVLIKIEKYLAKENIKFHELLKARLKIVSKKTLREGMVSELKKRGFFYQQKPSFDIDPTTLVEFFL